MGYDAHGQLGVGGAHSISIPNRNIPPFGETIFTAELKVQENKLILVLY